VQGAVAVSRGAVGHRGAVTAAAAAASSEGERRGHGVREKDELGGKGPAPWAQGWVL
jgi:hypothetical protein